ncbi:MAG: tRNA (adenosine(37)-N6)-threonylcarbamoyltransferase complex ATPase subunit type 1 TsaE [Proteobacteria bacterium]|nr:tRNA (adenosine(37)-N6)-threonylcarbamoyltransferase complex ATPase subunit type 1 TsaE [Pseudomonadota bacterium]
MICHSLLETIQFGEILGSHLRAGDVIALRGHLGIGKTQLVHGIAKTYLNADVHVCSPSFTIINQYEANGRSIHHLDLYRLSTLEELESTGYWDIIEDPNALILIEWLEQVDRADPIDFVTIDIRFTDETGDLSASPREFMLLGQGELYERLKPLF